VLPYDESDKRSIGRRFSFFQNPCAGRSTRSTTGFLSGTSVLYLSVYVGPTSTSSNLKMPQWVEIKNDGRGEKTTTTGDALPNQRISVTLSSIQLSRDQNCYQTDDVIFIVTHVPQTSSNSSVQTHRALPHFRVQPMVARNAIGVTDKLSTD
jgi:hypothetical protein